MVPLFKPYLAPGADQAVSEVLRSGQLTEGAWVTKFEEAVGRYLGVDRVMATADVAVALAIALRLCGVGSCDEVLMSPMCCLSTSMPLAWLGAKPVWCDVVPSTGTLDPAELGRKLTPRTKAVVATHWPSALADIASVVSEAKVLGLPVIEDAGDAFGSEGIARCGADFTCLSFRGARFASCGEGGGLIAKDSRLEQLADRFKRYGMDMTTFRSPDGSINPGSDVSEWGFNGGMSNISAALGLANLSAARGLIDNHRANAAKLVGDHGVICGSCWCLNLLFIERQKVQESLKREGFQSQPLHVRNDRYSVFGPPQGQLPGVDEFDAKNLAVPCGWWLTDEDRNRMVTALSGMRG